jgi:hypothetical protein
MRSWNSSVFVLVFCLQVTFDHSSLALKPTTLIKVFETRKTRSLQLHKKKLVVNGIKCLRKIKKCSNRATLKISSFTEIIDNLEKCGRGNIISLEPALSIPPSDNACTPQKPSTNMAKKQ